MSPTSSPLPGASAVPTSSDDTSSTPSGTSLHRQSSKLAEPMHASTFHANTQSSQTSGLPTEIQQHLGNLLKASYNDILTAPVPDRFMQLLAQFDAPAAAIASDDFTPVTDSAK